MFVYVIRINFRDKSILAPNMPCLNEISKIPIPYSDSKYDLSRQGRHTIKVNADHKLTLNRLYVSNTWVTNHGNSEMKS